MGSQERQEKRRKHRRGSLSLHVGLLSLTLKSPKSELSAACTRTAIKNPILCSNIYEMQIDKVVPAETEDASTAKEAPTAETSRSELPGPAEDTTMDAAKQPKDPDGNWQDEPNLLEYKGLGILQAAETKGVVYMSRVPPHLKPLKLRHMLSQYGEIGRLYLAPEDPGVRKRRKKLKGNTGKSFSEGWVEFTDKKVAKRVAEMLNGNQMGGKRRSAYHYDLWNLKYLPKFEWDHLTEEIAYQNAVREQKLANEISVAKRERDFYLTQVNRAKAEDAKEKRRKRKAEDGVEQIPVRRQESGKQTVAGEVKLRRGIGQRKAKLDPTDDVDAPRLSNETLALLAGKAR